MGIIKLNAFLFARNLIRYFRAKGSRTSLFRVHIMRTLLYQRNSH